MPKQYFWIGARVDEICYIVPNKGSNKENYPTSVVFKNGNSMSVSLDFGSAQQQLEAILRSNESVEPLSVQDMECKVQKLAEERATLRAEVAELEAIKAKVEEGYNGSAHALFLQWHNESRPYMRSDERQAILEAFEKEKVVQP